jgi:hypothetical protein
VVGLVAVLVAGCDPSKDDVQRDEAFTLVELGTFTAAPGETVDVPVDVPAGATSALVFCGPYTWEIDATFTTVTDPAGATAWTAGDPLAGGMRVGTYADLLPALVPQSAALPLSEGLWTFGGSFDAEDAVTVTCNAVLREVAAPADPRIDLRLVFVGVDIVVDTLNAQEAPTSALVQDTLARAEALLAGAGVGLGEVRYEDFDGDPGLYNIIDSDELAGQLLRTTPAEQGRLEVPVYLVPVLDPDIGDEGAAWTPMPGVAGVGGTSRSGLVLGTRPLTEGDTDTMGQRLAREVMFFLGAWPTQDATGAFADPLDGTPVCTDDADGDGVYSAGECAGAGAENLLWWSMQPGSTDLVPDQGWAIARSAIAL